MTDTIPHAPDTAPSRRARRRRRHRRRKELLLEGRRIVDALADLLVEVAPHAPAWTAPGGLADRCDAWYRRLETYRWAREDGA